MQYERKEVEWWELEDKPHEKVFTSVKSFDDHQRGIQHDNVRHMRLYSNKEASGLTVANYVVKNISSAPGGRTNRISLNVVASAVDTLISRIGKNKVRPYFLTSKGSWKQQKKAKLLNRFTVGMFYQAGVYKVTPKAFRDACIFGTGIVHVFSKDGQVEVERVVPDELLVDENDAYYGEPRTMYRRKFVSKSVLLKAYGEDDATLEAKIKTCEEVTLASHSSINTVQVVEAWHLPSSKDAGDGKHVICISNCTLLEEPWESDRFPFAVMHYNEPVLGFFGQGVAETLSGIQVEINRLLIHVQESMRLLSNPRVYIDISSKVNPAHINNQIGGIVPYQGTPPVIQAAQAVHPSTFQQIESLYQKAYEIVGVSQLSAQSSKPAGLDSGKALREFADIETTRFARTEMAFQDFHLDIARLALEEMKRIISRGKESDEKKVEYMVKAFGRKEGLEEIKWSEIDLDEDAYVMQCFPTSALPTEPGARLQNIIELSQAMPGQFTPDIVADLLDFPDLDAYSDLINSPVRLARKTIERIIDKGIYVTPEPDFNLQVAAQLASLYINDLRLYDDVDENALEALRRFRDECVALLSASAPQPQAQAPMVPAV